MTTEYNLDEIEALGKAWTDQFAARAGWEDHVLIVPESDLELFFCFIPGTIMLDVGCGWGRYVNLFVEQGLTYQGIDHSVEMLKVARRNNPEALFHEGSFRALPFPTDHFDGLWSCCSLSAFPKLYLVSILQEHLRVLKSGGVLHIVMPDVRESQEVLYTDKANNPKSFQAYYQIDEFLMYVAEAGFKIISAKCRFHEGAFYVTAKKP